MPQTELTPQARSLLQQLGSGVVVAQYDPEAAKELIEKGLAASVPTEGAIEITQAGREARRAM